jgi:hypothetical protein
MSGATPPFLHISSWRVQDNFTLYFTKLKPRHNNGSSFRLPAQICDQSLHSKLSGMTCSQQIQRCSTVKDHFGSSLSLACHEDKWRRGLTAPRLLNSVPVVIEWSHSRSVHLNPGWRWVWVRPWAGEKKKETMYIETKH